MHIVCVEVWNHALLTSALDTGKRSALPVTLLSGFRVIITLQRLEVSFQNSVKFILENTAEPGYNDIDLYNASSIAINILGYRIVRHCNTLYSSVPSTLLCNDKKYSDPSEKL